MKLVYWVIVILASGSAVQGSEVPESKPQGNGPLVGYVFCSNPPAEQYASMLLDVCEKLPAGRVSCGGTVSVVQRRGDWLELAFPDKHPRYLPLNLVSQDSDKFVSFDSSSGIPDGGAIDCPVPPVPPEPREREPRAIYAPDPEYSENARAMKISGIVVLSLIVGVDGLPRDIRVYKGLGYGLDEKALEAVQKWKFQPAMKDGHPFETPTNVEISFRTFEPPSRQSGGVYTGLPCAEKIDSRDIKDLLKKAYKGDPKAQFIIGCACEYGVARQAPDRAQAIDWYRKAAASLVPAQYFLGETYLLNFDYVNAYTWLRLANLGGYNDPHDKLKTVTLILSKEQLSEAEEQVAAWKRQHGTN
jgi:TonB family protein